MLSTTGKFQLLDDLLPQIRGKGDRVLIFSQVEISVLVLALFCSFKFTMLLDVLERYLKIRGHKYLRLDGQTPVQVRQTSHS